MTELTLVTPPPVSLLHSPLPRPLPSRLNSLAVLPNHVSALSTHLEGGRCIRISFNWSDKSTEAYIGTMKLLGSQQNRYVQKTLDSIAKNVSEYRHGSWLVSIYTIRPHLQLCRIQDPNTVNVVLNGFAINETKLATLAMSLVSNEHVKSLYLHNTGINPRGANLIAFALRSNKCLEHLSLNDNIIGSEGCSAIAAALHENHTLVSLGLSNNGITTHGARKLSKMLKEKQEVTSLTRIFLDGNEDIDEKILNKIDRYCLKIRAKNKNIRSSCNKSHASTSPCSDTGSITSSQQDPHRGSLGSTAADQGTTQSSVRAEYDLFKEVIGYESVNSLHTSLNASNLASYIERVHKNENRRALEEELGPEYFASNTDLGTSFLSTASDKQDGSSEKKRDKHGYFKGMKWPSSRKVHDHH